MDDVLAQAFHEAAAVSQPQPQPQAQPQPQPQAQPQTQPQLPTNPNMNLLSLVHFLLSVQAAQPVSPEGLGVAMSKVPVPNTLDEAAASMERIFQIEPERLAAVLGPPGDTTSQSQNTPRAMLQYLLQRVAAEGGPAIARVSLQAVLLRWLEQKLVTNNDPRTASVLSASTQNLDMIHSLSASSSNSSNNLSGLSNNTSRQQLQPALKTNGNNNSASGRSKGLIIGLSVLLVIMGACIIVVAVYAVRMKQKGIANGDGSGGGGGEPLSSSYGGRRVTSFDPPDARMHGRYQQPTFAPL